MIVAIVIKNCICTIAWTALAFHFDKWWIALFALLFVTTPGMMQIHYRSCDGCGKRSPGSDDYNKTLDLAAKAGWLHRKNGDIFEDFCPDCRKKLEEKENCE